MELINQKCGIKIHPYKHQNKTYKSSKIYYNPPKILNQTKTYRNVIKFQLQKRMHNNDRSLQSYIAKDLSIAILQWLEQQMTEILSSSKKKFNIELVTNDIYSQPFLGKFLLKVNYQFFSNTQLIDLIDGIQLRKMSFDQRKGKFLSLIEKYLQSQQRKKFAQYYRECLFKNGIGKDQERSSHQVIRLLLFIAIRSENKDQFIQRIFNMPVQYQQSLMDQIMEVQGIFENITEKQELSLQFNSLKQINKQMKENYQELVDYQNELLDECEKEEFAKSELQKKVQENRNQKINICQSLGINDPQKPYLKVYQDLNQKNATLTRILVQKQKKENQLHQQHSSLKSKLDEFEQVLFELKDEKKILKVVLNDKKNQSFQLEMRASVRLSHDNENFKISQALKRKSQAHFDTSLKDVMNLSAWDNRLRAKTKRENLPEFNQSVNIMSKIEELKSQKQALKKQLGQANAQNQRLRLKDSLSKGTFKQLSEIYSEFLSFCPLIVEAKPAFKKQLSPEIFEAKRVLRKQRSRTTLKRIVSRYQELQNVE